MRLICLVIACTVGSAVGSPLEAEERTWFFANDSLTQVSVTNGGREWTENWRLPLPNHGSSQPIVVAGGRYIVWGAYTQVFSFVSSALVRFDTKTRDIALVPGLSPGLGVQLGIDRRNGRLVVLDAAALYTVDVEGLRVVGTIPLPAPSEALERTLAVAGGRAFVGTRMQTTGETHVVELDSGQIVTIVPNMWFVRACPDETRVYLQRVDTQPTEPYVVVHADIRDAQSLTSIGTAILHDPVHAVGGYMVSELFGVNSVRVRAHDPDTLAVFFEAVAPLPFFPGTLRELHEASPVAPIIVRTQSRDVYTWEIWRSILVFDRATLTFVRELSDAPFDESQAKLVMLAPPVAPDGLAAAITGSSVVLSWHTAPDIGDYELSAGFAPGSRNIGSYRTGGAPSLRIDGVPPGTYYVRVRAINELGAAESEEVRVVVP